VGGVPECVGVAGRLVPPADDAALAGAVITLLRDPGLRSRLGAAAQQRVRQLFSADTQVPRIECALARAAAVAISG
jgi:glycosyltransferase involved in cell wall biosynthesis